MGYAPLLVITDLAAVSCDSAVVAVDFAMVEIEVAETEVVVGIAVAETEVAETGIDSSVFADTEGVGVATAGTEGSDLMIDGVETADIEDADTVGNQPDSLPNPRFRISNVSSFALYQDCPSLSTGCPIKILIELK